MTPSPPPETKTAAGPNVTIDGVERSYLRDTSGRRGLLPASVPAWVGTSSTSSGIPTRPTRDQERDGRRGRDDPLRAEPADVPSDGRFRILAPCSHSACRFAAAAAAPAACPAPLAPAALERAFARRNPPGAPRRAALRRRDGLRSRSPLPCLDADRHPLASLRATTRSRDCGSTPPGDERRAVLAFAAARWADRDATDLGGTRARGTRDPRALRFASDRRRRHGSRCPRRAGCDSSSTGTERSVRPHDWPTLFQIEGSDVETVYLAARRAYAGLPGGRSAGRGAAVRPLDAPARLPLGTRAPCRQVVAGVFYALAGSSAQTFQADQPSWDRADLEAQRAQTQHVGRGVGRGGRRAVGGLTSARSPAGGEGLVAQGPSTGCGCRNSVSPGP